MLYKLPLVVVPTAFTVSPSATFISLPPCKCPENSLVYCVTVTVNSVNDSHLFERLSLQTAGAEPALKAHTALLM